MKFNSVKEYFYKLNNTGYQLMMVPLILFIYHYASVYAFATHTIIQDVRVAQYLLVSVATLGLITLTAVHFWVQSQAQKISLKTGLGLKLELLGSVLMRRLIALALITLLMPLGLMLTHHIGFTVGFVVALVWYFFNWPTPTKVCHLLNLKGDEKEMVLSRGEAFK
jgi:hypothetical protein